MAEITPTPDAGTWLRITGVPDVADPPRAGTWLRVDSVSIPRRNGWVVGRLAW